MKRLDAKSKPEDVFARQKQDFFLSVYSAHFLTDVYDPSLLCEYLHFQEAQNRTLSCVRAV